MYIEDSKQIGCVGISLLSCHLDGSVYVGCPGGQSVSHQQLLVPILAQVLSGGPAGAITEGHVLPGSGHGAMKENYFLDDGAYSALQIIVETAKQQVDGGKSITEDLLGKLPEPLEAAEFRLKLQVRPGLHIEA